MFFLEVFSSDTAQQLHSLLAFLQYLFNEFGHLIHIFQFLGSSHILIHQVSVLI